MSESQEIRHADGRVELRAPDELKASPLYNHDLAPVEVKRRTWNTWDCSSGPSLISSYDGTPTAYGAGLRDHLRSAG